MSDLEARVLADLVEGMPEPRRSAVRARFAAIGQRMAGAGLPTPTGNAADLPQQQLEALGQAYFELGIACPFLEDERCSIYDDRPLVCRKVAVTSPAGLCSNAGDDRIDYLRVPPLGTAVLLMTSDKNPPQPSAVLLPFLLDWIEANRAPGRRRGADQWMQRFVQRLTNG
jgi:Fe-S-cluster containining protein